MEDVLQEAYLRAFRALPRFRGDSGVGTWLYRIVYNAALDELRRSRRRFELSLRQLEFESEAVPDPAEVVPAQRAIAHALMRLSPEDRAVVVLVDGQGFRYDEAARVLGVPPGTVASRLNRARSALRRALRDAEGPPAS